MRRLTRQMYKLNKAISLFNHKLKLPKTPITVMKKKKNKLDLDPLMLQKETNLEFAI